MSQEAHLSNTDTYLHEYLSYLSQVNANQVHSYMCSLNIALYQLPIYLCTLGGIMNTHKLVKHFKERLAIEKSILKFAKAYMKVIKLNYYINMNTLRFIYNQDSMTNFVSGSIRLVWLRMPEYSSDDAETEELRIPLRYLCSANWRVLYLRDQEALRVQKRKLELESKEREKIAKLKQAVAHEAFEKREYRRLRIKYGDRSIVS